MEGDAQTSSIVGATTPPKYETRSPSPARTTGKPSRRRSSKDLRRFKIARQWRIESANAWHRRTTAHRRGSSRHRRPDLDLKPRKSDVAMVKALGYSIDTFEPRDPGRPVRGASSGSIVRARGTARRRACGRAAHGDQRVRVHRRDRARRDARSPVLGPHESARRSARSIAPSRVRVLRGRHPGEVLPCGPARRTTRRRHRRCAEHVVRALGDAVSPSPKRSIRRRRAGADVLLVFGEAPKRRRARRGPAQGAVPPPGFRTEGPPARRFQSAAIVAVLEHVKRSGWVHLDKHAPEPRALRGDPRACFPALGKAAGAVGALRFRSRSADACPLGSGALGAAARLAADRSRRLPRAAGPRARRVVGGRTEEAEEQEWPAGTRSELLHVPRPRSASSVVMRSDRRAAAAPSRPTACQHAPSAPPRRVVDRFLIPVESEEAACLTDQARA
jgi:hypothetical protein